VPRRQAKTGCSRSSSATAVSAAGASGAQRALDLVGHGWGDAAPDGEPYGGDQSGVFGAVLRLLEALGREAPYVTWNCDPSPSAPSMASTNSGQYRG
jgi:hypothetical protein